MSCFKETTKKKNVAVAAFTGSAAIQVGGQTVHSLFKLGLGPQDTDNEAAVRTPANSPLSSIDVLILDEVSMLRCDILDMIDAKLQSAKGNKQYFGGVQVIAFGDLYQLPPIASNPVEMHFVMHKYGTLFFFGAAGSLGFKKIELKTVLRQKDDSFIRILNHIREGNAEDIDFINRKCLKPAPEDWMRLTLRRDVAKRINLEHLAQIQSPERVYETEIGGNSPPSDKEVPFDYLLRVKVGAKVILTSNDTEKRYYNGTIGIVQAINENSIKVKTEFQVIDIERVVYEKKQYRRDAVSKELICETVGWAKQFPLRLAYAITIHKSQGQTFDHVVIDYSGGTAFSPGQTYVALSRCKSLDGICLTRALTDKDIYVDPDIVRYMNSPGAIAIRIPEKYR